MSLTVSDIGLRRATLDEVFLSLTGRPADAESDPGTDGSAAPTTRSRRRRRAAA
jgi:ABC-2 type transport system ATP-binding protein